MPDPFRVEQSLDSTAFGGGRSMLTPSLLVRNDALYPAEQHRTVREGFPS